MAKIIGQQVIDSDVLAHMRNRSGRWAAYQNQSERHPDFGHLTFLQFGHGRTYSAPPERHPGTAQIQGWHYLHVGTVDLPSGRIVGLDEAASPVPAPLPEPGTPEAAALLGTDKPISPEGQRLIDDMAARPGPVLTEADAAADLAGTPRPDNPSVPSGIEALDAAMEGGIPPEALAAPAMGVPGNLIEPPEPPSTASQEAPLHRADEVPSGPTPTEIESQPPAA